MARLQRMRGNILHAAVRSTVLSGAALLTAGTIAVTPIQQVPHMSAQAIGHSVSTAAVDLTANAFDLYGQVFKSTVTNLQSDVQSYFELGLFPLLRQVLTNQVGTMTGLIDALGDSGRALVTTLTQKTPSYLGAALGDLGKANVEAALNNLQLAIVAPIMAVINPVGTLPTALGNLISQPLQSVINIAKDLPNLLLNLGLGVIGPVAAGLGAVGAAVQHVINAVAAGNLGKLVTAVIQAPATIADGIFNGGYGPNLGALLGIDIPGYSIFGGGLFGGGATVPGGGVIAGTLQSLVSIVKSLLNDISPQTKTPAAATAAVTTTTKSASDVASLPTTTAATVALSAAATAKATGTTATTDKATTDATDPTDAKSETKSDPKTDATKTDASADATKTGSTAEGTDAKSDSSTGDAKAGTATGSSSSSSSSGASGSTSDSSSGSTGEGTKTTTSGSKGSHSGSSKSGSDSSSTGSASSSTGSSTKGTHSKGSHAKGSHSKGSSKTHHAA